MVDAHDHFHVLTTSRLHGHELVPLVDAHDHFHVLTTSRLHGHELHGRGSPPGDQAPAVR